MPTYLPTFTSAAGEAKVFHAYQAVMDNWPVPYTELEVPTRCGLTHVIANGPADAPPLVLLHALFATATAWVHNVGPLSRHFRTYAVDVMGEANRSRPARVISTLDEMAEWFTDLLDGLGVGQAGLVGNSYGGFMSAYCAMRRPERVRRLALIGPAATFCPMPAFYLHMFIPKALGLFFPWLPGGERFARHGLDWMQAGLPRDPAWAELFYLTLRHGAMTTRILPRVYTAQEFAQIQVPSLLILGERERIYNPQVCAAAARRLLPGIEVELISAAHHITALAQPQRVNARLLEFFSPPGPGVAAAPVSEALASPL
jgi:pimeloyl-ACP methyl ester carboxylesterase